MAALAAIRTWLTLKSLDRTSNVAAPPSGAGPQIADREVISTIQRTASVSRPELLAADSPEPACLLRKRADRDLRRDRLTAGHSLRQGGRRAAYYPGNCAN